MANNKLKAQEKATLVPSFIQEQTKKANAIIATSKDFLPISQAKNLTDVTIMLTTAEEIQGVFSFKVCKIFEKVKNEKLYEGHYKNFVEWALTRNVKKVQAYDKAKVGKYINEDGTASTLPRASEDFDYTYTQIVEMIGALVKMDRKTGEIIDDTLMINACKEGKIFPRMAVKDFRKTLKTLKALANGEEIAEATEATEATNEATNEATEATNEATEATNEATEATNEATEATNEAKKQVVLSLTIDEINELIKGIKKLNSDMLLSDNLATKLVKVLKKSTK